MPHKIRWGYAWSEFNILKAILFTIIIFVICGKVFAQRNFIAYYNSVGLTYTKEGADYPTYVPIRNKSDLEKFKNIKYKLDTSLYAVGLVRFRKRKALFKNMGPFEFLDEEVWKKFDYKKMTFYDNFGSKSRGKITTDSILHKDDFGSDKFDYLFVPIPENQNLFNPTGNWQRIDSANQMREIYSFNKHPEKEYTNCTLTYINSPNSHSLTIEFHLYSIEWRDLETTYIPPWGIFIQLGSDTKDGTKVESYSGYLHPNEAIKEIITFKKLPVLNSDSIANYFAGQWYMKSGFYYHGFNKDTPARDTTKVNYAMTFKKGQVSSNNYFEMTYLRNDSSEITRGTWEIGETGMFLRMKTESSHETILSLSELSKDSFIFCREIGEWNMAEEDRFDPSFEVITMVKVNH